MGTTIEIAAVGDILMWNTQIAAAATGKGGYHFDSMFSEIAPVLKAADLTIGNLETTLSGREKIYQRKNPNTGYPRFNCPDELAATLKRSGFHVLTTANNHSMDRGESGLKRTIRVLDQHGIQHTGTFETRSKSTQVLVRDVKGVRVGLLSYTYGTNYIAVPKPRPWLVNRISISKIKSDLSRLRNRCDIIVVAMHFGTEFQRFPNKRQKSLVDMLFRNGADIVLGAHPHVLQPVVVRTVTDVAGRRRKRIVAYSLGNFISDRMMKNPYANIGLVLKITIHKDSPQDVRIQRVSYVPTWVQKSTEGQKVTFKVIPTARYRRLKRDSALSGNLERIHKQTLRHVWTQVT